MFFFFNDTATTGIYTLALHDALPIWRVAARGRRCPGARARHVQVDEPVRIRVGDERGFEPLIQEIEPDPDSIVEERLLFTSPVSVPKLERGEREEEIRANGFVESPFEARRNVQSIDWRNQ